jgi:hypothetical protein
MQILQLIGVLIIVNALTCAGWLMSHERALGGGGVTLLIIAVVSGLALTFHERAIEITFGKVASLKAAAQQATTDAREIAAIRQRVEAQAATLDLVAKASSDATRLIDGLKEETKNADEKLKELEKKTAEAARLAEPAKLKLHSAVRNTEVQELCATVFFAATKNEAFGRLDFEVTVLGGSSVKILKLWPSIKAGAFQSGEKSFQPSHDGRSATLAYMPMGAEFTGFDITLSAPATIRITGNRMFEPVELRIE